MLAKLLAQIPLNGNKTWIAGVGLILFAVGGYLSGTLPADEAVQRLLEGLGIVGIGHKIEKLLGGDS